MNATRNFPQNQTQGTKPFKAECRTRSAESHQPDSELRTPNSELKTLHERLWHLTSVGLGNCHAAQRVRREIEQLRTAAVPGRSKVPMSSCGKLSSGSTGRVAAPGDGRCPPNALANQTLDQLASGLAHLESVGLTNSRAAQAIRSEIQRRIEIESQPPAHNAVANSSRQTEPEPSKLASRVSEGAIAIKDLIQRQWHLESVGLGNCRAAQAIRCKLSEQLLIQSAILTNANFNPNEPRDSHGQWTTNAGGTATNNPRATNNPAATNSPSATSIPPSKVRAMIVAAALKNKGSEKWMLGKAVGNFKAGTNKCNKFVADNCNSIGLGMIVPDIHTTRHGKYPPTAGDWANPSVNIPGWVVVTNPQPGDVAAEKHFYIDATGHCAIVVRVGGSYGGLTVGTSTNFGDTIVQTDWGFRPEQKGKVVFRRYIGVPKK